MTESEKHAKDGQTSGGTELGLGIVLPPTLGLVSPFAPLPRVWVP